MTKNERAWRRGGMAVLATTLCALSWSAASRVVPLTARLASSTTSLRTWYAPYIDATLPPEWQAANRAIDPAQQDVFGFIVAAHNEPCQPSWGDYYSLSGINSSQLHLGSVIAAMRAEGEIPIVSFGGEANQPLADVCTSASALAGAYEQVINAYHAKVLDFDIEGAAQGQSADLVRQAEAIRAVQAQAAKVGSTLGVWLTLPVATTGMLPVAEKVVDTMLAGGVQLSGVNLMTMYFWPAPGNGAPMLTAVEDALVASHSQLKSLFSSYGIDLDSTQVWQHMGATVQIGQEGVADEAFTVNDARGLVAFAESHQLGRISDWSVNQDEPCGSAADPTVGGYSNYCSGVVQTPGQFGKIFAALTGRATDTPLVHAVNSPSTQPVPIAASSSSTSSSGTGSSSSTSSSGTGSSSSTGSSSHESSSSDTPNPKGHAVPWSFNAAYPGGSLVTYGGAEYEAKWWSQGSVPTTDVPHPWDTPWKYLGPIPNGGEGSSSSVSGGGSATTGNGLPSSSGGTTDPPASSAGGPYPAWSSAAPYPAGYKVDVNGEEYEAKWWNRDFYPATPVAHPWDTPWKLLGPVPSGDQVSPLHALPVGTYPAWSATTVYVAGNRVLFDGLPYEAKWWNEGSSPQDALDHPYSSPWRLLETIPGEPSV